MDANTQPFLVDFPNNEDFDKDVELLMAAPLSELLTVLEEVMLKPSEFASEDKVGNSTRQKEHGIYYTSFKLARILVDDCVRRSSREEPTFLEPCVGGGAFLFAFIESQCDGELVTEDFLRKLLNRCYIAENDVFAVKHLMKIIPVFLGKKYGHALAFPKQNVLIGDSLLESENGEAKIRKLNEHFSVPQGFDIVMTNPPYKLLRKDRRYGQESGELLEATLQKWAKKSPFSLQGGNQNLYKLFVEAIFKWVSADGLIGLLVPRSLLTDKSSEKLREKLLTDFSVERIIELPEGNTYFRNVGQAFSMFSGLSGEDTHHIQFGKMDRKGTSPVFGEKVSIESLKRITGSNALHNLSAEDIEFLEKVREIPRVEDTKEIINLRGEYDISLDSSFLTEGETCTPVVFGKNLGIVKFGKSPSRVRHEFLNRPKGKWVNRPRIACPQISNMNSERRLKWSHVGPGHVLANSCNFIGLADDTNTDQSDSRLLFYLGILNSELVNKYFKLLSANNHISNMEINSLPVGFPNGAKVSEIVCLMDEAVNSGEEPNMQLLNQYVRENFGIFKPDTERN